MAFQPERLTDTKLYRKLSAMGPVSGVSPDYVKGLCDEASAQMKIVPWVLPQFTLHDEVHLLRVTELMSFVLGPTLEQLNALEVALLILAAHFHDIGMAPDAAAWAETEKSPDFQLYRDLWLSEHPNAAEIEAQIERAPERAAELGMKRAELEYAMRGEYVRRTHGERSAAFVRAHAGDPRLTLGGVCIADELAELCLSHVEDAPKLTRFAVDQSLGNHQVNLRYLALILRLGDILDFDRERTPDSLFRTIHFTSNVSLTEWEKHRGVRGWVISPELLRFEMEFDQPIYERAARQFLDFIDAELDAAREMVSEFPAKVQRYTFNLPWRVDRTRVGPHNKAYVYHDLEFSLSRDEVVKLLMTESLYGSPSLCVRELLQNSLDALRYRSALWRLGNAKFEGGEVSFTQGIDREGNQFLSCRDNGVGMDEQIILSFLTKVGRSFYRSPFFEQERQRFRQKGVDFDPCSQFGIGFMSCFMLGDRIRVETRRDYGIGSERGKPWIVEINGLSSLLTLRPGPPNQEVGTSVTITMRGQKDVQLRDTLQKYAVAVEFPVHGEVPGQERFTIPPEMHPAITFLEAAGVKQLFRLEQTISQHDTSGTVKGQVADSFLTDAEGHIVLENSEAKWTSRSGNEVVSVGSLNLGQMNAASLYPTLQVGDDQFSSYKIERNTSRWLCADGILVDENYMPMPISGGPRQAMACVIDTRGRRKPGLTPSRNTTRQGAASKYLEDLYQTAFGRLWGQLLEVVPGRLSHETFWKLAVVQNFPVELCPPQVLWDKAALPARLADQVDFVPLNGIADFELTRKGESLDPVIVLPSGHEVQKIAAGLVLGLSEWNANGSRLSCRVLPPDVSLTRLPYTASYDRAKIRFGPSLRSAFAVRFDNQVYSNPAHPLRQVQVANLFPTLLDFALSGWGQKMAGDSYLDLDWDNADPWLRPPYKVFVDGEGWTEITDAEIRSWAALPDDTKPTEKTRSA